MKSSSGIEGKKGVLWWQINDILSAKKPAFVLLENVDRLVKSPAKQRGRDFGIMLRCFSDQGYAIEWRIINAADYGHPQRRRRIYIFAYHKSTSFFKRMKSLNPCNVLEEEGLFAKQFPVDAISKKIIKVTDVLKDYKDLVEVSDAFKFDFHNSGFMINGKVYTAKVTSKIENAITLGQIAESDVDSHYYLSDSQKAKFKYLRGTKKIPRIDKKTGHEYMYTEGAMSPFDELTLPGRTMLTSEGTTNRSTHIIKDPKTNKLRILTPVECERLNQFPDNWTNCGMPEKRRYFMMGNALVCGIIKKIAKEINTIIDKED